MFVYEIYETNLILNTRDWLNSHGIHYKVEVDHNNKQVIFTIL